MTENVPNMSAVDTRSILEHSWKETDICIRINQVAELLTLVDVTAHSYDDK
jgi:hypothetical protein